MPTRPSNATLAVALGLACFALGLRADDAKPAEAPKPPAVKFVTPLAVAPGEKLTVRLRGTNLDDATEVKASGPNAAAVKVEVKGKGKSDGEDGIKRLLGDTQVDVEVTLPADAPPGDELKLAVVTPHGEAAPSALHVVPAEQLVSEVEPNGGFRQSQEIKGDRRTVRAAFNENKDVDVYRVAGKAGQTLRAKVIATAKGSAADPALTLYDAHGHVLAADDDVPGSPAPRDPRLEYKLLSDGDVFVVVTDVNESGGPLTHTYLLNVAKQ